MDKIGHILYCVEDDLDSAALDRTVRVAEKASAKLTVGAFVKPARSQILLARGSFDLDEVERLLVEDRQRQLAEAAGSIGDTRTEVVTRVFVGDPVHAAIKAVQQEGFDLLVKQPSPTQGLRQQLFGSIDMRLMRACPCPVLIGRVKADGYSGHAVAAIAYDEGDEIAVRLNHAILDSAAFILDTQFAFVRELHIVHAWSLYGESLLASGRGKLPANRLQAALQEEEEKRSQWLSDLVESHRNTLDGTRAANFNPKLSLLHGDPMIVIPRFIKELDADVLAVGTISRGGIGGLLIGNTAEAILNRVNCSVVARKPEGFEAPTWAR